MRQALLLLCLSLWAAPALAQSNAVNSGASLPTGCVSGSVYITTTTPTLYVCAPANTWTAVTWNGALPSGSIVFVATGSCPTSYTEVTALNGKMIRGTLAANGNVGTTGGNDTYTPAGTISALTFTGSAWAAPAVAWPAGVPTHTGTAASFTGNSVTSSAVTGGTPAGTISALTTGADSSTTGGVAKAVAQTPTFTGSALATHTHTTTATGSVTITAQGTVAWPAGVPTLAAYTPAGTVNTPALTGTPATVVPAYTLLIACSKN